MALGDGSDSSPFGFETFGVRSPPWKGPRPETTRFELDGEMPQNLESAAAGVAKGVVSPKSEPFRRSYYAGCVQSVFDVS